MPPDLTHATDAALSAFLHRELFGKAEMVMRPAVDVWDEVTHYDPEFHHEPDHPAWAFLTYEIDGETFYEALDDLCTPSGALRVIEATGAKLELVFVHLMDPARPRNHFCRFSEQGDVTLNFGADGWARDEEYPRAVCLAAVLSLLPAASEEGRRILRADTRAHTP